MSDLLDKLKASIAALPEKEKQGLFSQQWEAQQSMQFFSRVGWDSRRMNSNVDILEYYRERIKDRLTHHPIEALQIIDLLDIRKGMKFERYEEIMEALKEGIDPREIVETLTQDYRYEPEGVDEMIEQELLKERRKQNHWVLNFSDWTAPIP
jgi:hypothetical protein